MEKLSNYINGRLVAPSGGQYIQNIEPSSGAAYSLIPNSGAVDVGRALRAAKIAFCSWGKSSREYRSKWMMRLADAIDKHSKKLVLAESKDTGKPVWLAKKMDIPRASENFRFFATEILHFSSKIYDSDGGALNYVLREPIGVAGCISPWNLPLYLLTWKIAPAIAAGNTVVAKPSEITPYTAYLLGEICKEIQFPKGVINIVHGYGGVAGDAIVRGCDIVSFTGGTETGRKVALRAAEDFKKCSLEMGGKNPTIIFRDADLDVAITQTIRSGFLNQGQICLCGSRVFVEKSVFKKFKSRLISGVSKLIVGDPKKNSVNLGAIVSKEHLCSILKKIQDAKNNGSKVLYGGNRVLIKGLRKGFFMNPTIIEEPNHLAAINQEEVFGPVISLIPFDTEEAVIKMCNDVKYGLSASIFSNCVSRCHRVAAKIDCGIVWINAWLIRDLRIPFGGMKHSGLGREGGHESLNFFTETKNVCVVVESEKNK